MPTRTPTPKPPFVLAPKVTAEQVTSVLVALVARLQAEGCVAQFTPSEASRLRLVVRDAAGAHVSTVEAYPVESYARDPRRRTPNGRWRVTVSRGVTKRKNRAISVARMADVVDWAAGLIAAHAASQTLVAERQTAAATAQAALTETLGLPVYVAPATGDTFTIEVLVPNAITLAALWSRLHV